MPVFRVSRSITIGRPAHEVFRSLMDFRRWKEWSPWFLSDPKCTIHYFSDSDGMGWEGSVSGKGEIRLGLSEEDQKLRFLLVLYRPHRSRSEVTFEIEKLGTDQCELRWSSDGALPFFVFWLKSMMEALVGDDVERGLVMLKDYLEKGSRQFELEFEGKTQVEQIKWIGIRRKCNKPDMGFRISQDHQTLQIWTDHNSTRRVGAPLAIYHKWNIQQQWFIYTAAVPVEELTGSIPSGFVTGQIPAMNVYSIHLNGSYKYLPNAWATGVMHGRAGIYKPNRQHPPFEQFENRPDIVDDSILDTRLFFPCKG